MARASYFKCPVCGFRHCPVGEPCPNCDANPDNQGFSSDLVDYLARTTGRLTKSSFELCNAGSRAFDRS